MYKEDKCIRSNQMIKILLRSKGYESWNIYETSEWNTSSV